MKLSHWFFYTTFQSTTDCNLFSVDFFYSKNYYLYALFTVWFNCYSLILQKLQIVLSYINFNKTPLAQSSLLNFILSFITPNKQWIRFDCSSTEHRLNSHFGLLKKVIFLPAFIRCNQICICILVQFAKIKWKYYLKKSP